MHFFGGSLAPTLLLLAGALPSLAQETTTTIPESEIVFTIQTSVPTSFPSKPPIDPLPSSGNDASVLPITSVVTSIVSGFPTSIDTGIMSIPAGETPQATDSTDTASPTTPPASSDGPESSSEPSPSEEPSPSDTPAAAPSLQPGQIAPLFATACVGLSVVFGFGWLLL